MAHENRLQSPPGAEHASAAVNVIYAHTFPPADASPLNRARILIMALPALLFCILISMRFGSGWIVLGVLSTAAVLGFDEWLRFVRRKTRILVGDDGSLVVSTWHSSERHWLPACREIVVEQYTRWSGNRGDGTPTNGGQGLRLVLHQENASTTRIGLPGGWRFFPGGGPLMDDAAVDQLIATASRFTSARRG